MIKIFAKITKEKEPSNLNLNKIDNISILNLKKYIKTFRCTPEGVFIPENWDQTKIKLHVLELKKGFIIFQIKYTHKNETFFTEETASRLRGFNWGK